MSDGQKTFREECTEWLAPLGYSIHSHGTDDRFFAFWNTDEPYSPFIICTHELNGEKRCRLRGTILKMLIQMQVSNLSFKHPDIERFIRAFRHYERLCEDHPPKL